MQLDPTSKVDEEEADTDICAICLSGTVYEQNEILYCDSCNVAVHQSCYSVPEVPSGSWFCYPCSKNLDPNTLPCEVCSNVGGAYKATDLNKWVHPLCAHWIPEVYEIAGTGGIPFLNLSALDKKRFKLKCQICHTCKGASIQCSFGRCSNAAHPWCIMKNPKKSWTNRIIKNDDGYALYQVFCTQHQKAVNDPIKPKSKSKQSTTTLTTEDADNSMTADSTTVVAQSQGKVDSLVGISNGMFPNDVQQNRPLHISESTGALSTTTSKKAKGRSLQTASLSVMSMAHARILAKRILTEDRSSNETNAEGGYFDGTEDVTASMQDKYDATNIQETTTTKCKPADFNFPILTFHEWPGQSEGEAMDLDHFWNVISSYNVEDHSREWLDFMLTECNDNSIFIGETMKEAEERITSSLKEPDDAKLISPNKLKRGQRNAVNNSIKESSQDPPAVDELMDMPPLGKDEQRVEDMELVDDLMGSLPNDRERNAILDEQKRLVGLDRLNERIALIDPTYCSSRSLENRDSGPTNPLILTDHEFYTKSNIIGEGNKSKSEAFDADGCVHLRAVFDGEHRHLCDFKVKHPMLSGDKNDSNDHWYTLSLDKEGIEDSVEWAKRSLIPFTETTKKENEFLKHDFESLSVSLHSASSINEEEVVALCDRDIISRTEDNDIGIIIRTDQHAYTVLSSSIRKTLKQLQRKLLSNTIPNVFEEQRIHWMKLEQHYLKQQKWKNICKTLHRGMRDQQADFNKLLQEDVPASWKIQVDGRPKASSQSNEEDEFSEDAICMCCFDGSSQDGNNILFCDGCNAPLHQLCYGVSEIPSGDFFCDRCQCIQQLARERESEGFDAEEEGLVSGIEAKYAVMCCLCPLQHGGLKATTDGRWVHICCALWSREAKIDDIHTMNRIDVKNVPVQMPENFTTGPLLSAYHAWSNYGEDTFDATNEEFESVSVISDIKRPCVYCGVLGGYVVNCSFTGEHAAHSKLSSPGLARCNVTFHPLCAWFQGAYIRADITDPTFQGGREDGKLPAGLSFCFLCEQHSVVMGKAGDNLFDATMVDGKQLLRTKDTLEKVVEEQIRLRNKYRINEEDLECIPGVRRRRKKSKKKAAASAVGNKRITGGSQNKDLNVDVYTDSICAACLTPIDGDVFKCGCDQYTEPDWILHEDVRATLDNVPKPLPMLFTDTSGISLPEKADEQDLSNCLVKKHFGQYEEKNDSHSHQEVSKFETEVAKIRSDTADASNVSIFDDKKSNISLVLQPENVVSGREETGANAPANFSHTSSTASMPISTFASAPAGTQATNGSCFVSKSMPVLPAAPTTQYTYSTLVPGHILPQDPAATWNIPTQSHQIPIGQQILPPSLMPTGMVSLIPNQHPYPLMPEQLAAYQQAIVSGVYNAPAFDYSNAMAQANIQQYMNSISSYSTLPQVMSSQVVEQQQSNQNVPQYLQQGNNLAMLPEATSSSFMDLQLSKHLKCTRCGIVIHRQCYDGHTVVSKLLTASSISSTYYNWKCDLCAMKNAPKVTDVKCVLCPRRGGFFKRTSDGEWVHLYCARNCPVDTTLNAHNLLQLRIKEQKDKDKCCICNRKVGISIACSVMGCKASFHPICAMRSGKAYTCLRSTGRITYCPDHLPDEIERLPSGHWIDGHELGQLRYNLDRALVILDTVVRREKYKRMLCKAEMELFQIRFNNMLDKAKGRKPQKIGEQDVDMSDLEMSDYGDDEETDEEFEQLLKYEGRVKQSHFVSTKEFVPMNILRSLVPNRKILPDITTTASTGEKVLISGQWSRRKEVKLPRAVFTHFGGLRIGRSNVKGSSCAFQVDCLKKLDDGVTSTDSDFVSDKRSSFVDDLVPQLLAVQKMSMICFKREMDKVGFDDLHYEDRKRSATNISLVEKAVDKNTVADIIDETDEFSLTKRGRGRPPKGKMEDYMPPTKKYRSDETLINKASTEVRALPVVVEESDLSPRKRKRSSAPSDDIVSKSKKDTTRRSNNAGNSAQVKEESKAQSLIVSPRKIKKGYALVEEEEEVINDRGAKNSRADDRTMRLKQRAEKVYEEAKSLLSSPPDAASASKKHDETVVQFKSRSVLREALQESTIGRTLLHKTTTSPSDFHWFSNQLFPKGGTSTDSAVALIHSTRPIELSTADGWHKDWTLISEKKLYSLERQLKDIIDKVMDYSVPDEEVAMELEENGKCEGSVPTPVASTTHRKKKAALSSMPPIAGTRRSSRFISNQNSAAIEQIVTTNEAISNTDRKQGKTSKKTNSKVNVLRQVAEQFEEVPDKEVISDYNDYVRKLVCLKSINQRLSHHGYRSMGEFVDDFYTLLNNARSVTGAGSQIWKDAAVLAKVFEAERKRSATKSDVDTSRSSCRAVAVSSKSSSDISNNSSITTKCACCFSEHILIAWPEEMLPCEKYTDRSWTSDLTTAETSFRQELDEVIVLSQNDTKGEKQWMWLCSNCVESLGAQLIGCRVKVWWDEDEIYYGIVNAFDDVVTNKHRIFYEDGEWEFIYLAAEPVLFAPSSLFDKVTSWGRSLRLANQLQCGNDGEDLSGNAAATGAEVDVLTSPAVIKSTLKVQTPGVKMLEQYASSDDESDQMT